MVQSRLAHEVAEIVATAEDNASRMAHEVAEMVVTRQDNESRLAHMVFEMVTSYPRSELSAYTVLYVE